MSIRRLTTKILRHWWAPGDIPLVTLMLTTLVIATYAITQATGWAETIREALGLQPGKPQTYLTYAILHGNTQHLVENALLLMLLGPPLERMMGAKTYALTISGLIVLGAAASTILAPGYWPSGEHPIGMSTATFALITTGAYLLVLKTTGPAPRATRNLWAGVVISTAACAILVYSSPAVYGGPALVGHIAAFLGGTTIALAHAGLNTVRREGINPSL